MLFYYFTFILSHCWFFILLINSSLLSFSILDLLLSLVCRFTSSLNASTVVVVVPRHMGMVCAQPLDRVCHLHKVLTRHC